jgi:hypothetical protein
LWPLTVTKHSVYGFRKAGRGRVSVFAFSHCGRTLCEVDDLDRSAKGLPVAMGLLASGRPEHTHPSLAHAPRPRRPRWAQLVDAPQIHPHNIELTFRKAKVDD